MIFKILNKISNKESDSLKALTIKIKDQHYQCSISTKRTISRLFCVKYTFLSLNKTALLKEIDRFLPYANLSNTILTVIRDFFDILHGNSLQIVRMLFGHKETHKVWRSVRLQLQRFVQCRSLPFHHGF